MTTPDTLPDNLLPLQHLLKICHGIQRLISTPSFSGAESKTAHFLHSRLQIHGLDATRIGNNVVAKSPNYDPQRPTLLLCTHHDTVKPVAAYTRDPFKPSFETDADGRTRLYGLGSNDAGASIACMMDVMYHFYERTQEGANLPFNMLLVLAAEEEISGANGISCVLPQYPEISAAIVGEPTQMHAAVGERGLLVLDGVTEGVSGHTARQDGVNALYKAIDDINALRHFSFPIESPILGPISIQVTQIQAGTQHNVIPDRCQYVVDVRTTDAYTNEEMVDALRQQVQGTLTPRNMQNKASVIPSNHPLIDALTTLRIPPFISPTTSDWMRLNVPAIKMGPGDSHRSHTADEFIYLDELESGIKQYIQFIATLKL